MYQSESGMQEVIQMCSSFDSNKSTKGASKLRRDLINGEIANLRDLLPLPSSTRQRLSQLQLMALVCVYVRKANYFQQVFKRFHELGHPYSTPNIGFSKALSGFLIMMTQNGKLLYISDNAAEYLGHSMEDLLIHGDSVYDIIDKADHGTVQSELLRNPSNTPNSPGDETRLFLCRMNVSRNARRQMRFGDQKVVLLQGHYLSYLPLCSRNEPVFVATCTPVAMPETRECVVQGATNVFTTIHSMDMKFMHIDRNGEYYLGYTRSELGGISWYQLIHWNYMREAQSKHRLISQSEQEKSCILLLRLQTRSGSWIWVHCVLQVKDSSDSTSSGSNTSSQQPQQSVIVATNQVLSDREAAVMRANAWIYHYYTVQTKLQYGLAYSDGGPAGVVGSGSQAAAAARLVAATAYFPTQQLHYGTPSPQPHLHHQPQSIIPHHQISPDNSSNGAYGSSPLMTSTPHYPGTPGHHYSYHHHRHTYDVATFTTVTSGNNGIKKESPLDFSLAGSPIPPPFDFHLGSSNSGYPVVSGTGYWSHHHHPQYHSSSGYTSRASEGSPSSTVSLSATSPQNWCNSGSTSTQQGTTQKHQQLSTGNLSSSISVNPSHISPSSGSSNKRNVSSVRKRTKKVTVEVTNENSPSPPLLSDGTLHRRHYSPGISYQGNNGISDPTVATMSTLFPYHTRSRNLYKMIGTSDEDSGISSIKDESMGMMACPLTPSPIWEGQTQRVPDLYLYSDTNTAGVFGGMTQELVHCVPTYQPYLSFCSNPNTGVGGSNPTASYGFGYTYYGTSGLTTGPILLESGSPNKENRLPPTPESSDHDGENEENRSLKWETL